MLMRCGEFGVVARGDITPENIELPRFIVVQVDRLGPVMRLGPFYDFDWACYQAERLANDGWVGQRVPMDPPIASGGVR